MKKQRILALVFMFLVGLAVTAWAIVPPPPANQNLGFLDTAFETAGLERADCLAAGCHVEAGIEDRHHLLYNSTIPSLTVIPYIGLTTGQYNCLGCHDDVFVLELNCINCHGTYSDGTSAASPHHGTAQANAGDCQFCHGSLVDNSGDGHYIPTYDPSLVTPTPSQGDADQLNVYGNGAGACNYCHDSDTSPGGPGTGTTILSNWGTHHGINLIDGLNRCDWCHFMGMTPPSPIPPDWYANNRPDAIRGCEECHGPDSLHNIQTDSGECSVALTPCYSDAECPSGETCVKDGTLVIGGELAGFGHVGRDNGPNDSDCWGCHGFAGISGAAPGSGPAIPSVSGADVSTTTAGTATTVTLSGAAFTNIDGATSYSSDVALTGADGSTVTLTPDSISQDTITVTIPGDTAGGNYALQAVKAGVASNPAVVAVTPVAVVTDTNCANGTATITGSGFSGYQEGSGTEVTGTVTTGGGTDCSAFTDRRTCKRQDSCSWNNRADVCEGGGDPVTTTETGNVSSWTDTQIVAAFSACPQSVDVTTVYEIDGGGGTDPPDPPAECSDNTDQESCETAGCRWQANKDRCR